MSALLRIYEKDDFCIELFEFASTITLVITNDNYHLGINYFPETTFLKRAKDEKIHVIKNKTKKEILEMFLIIGENQQILPESKGKFQRKCEAYFSCQSFE